MQDKDAVNEDPRHPADPGMTRRGWLAYAGLGAVLGMAVLMLFAWNASRTKSAAPPAAGTLTPAHFYHDFGRVSMAKGPVKATYRLVNQDKRPALLRKLYTSCMCTKATLMHAGERTGPFGMPGHDGPVPPLNHTIGPGETVVVEAEFDPAAHGPAGFGKNKRVVSIEHSNGITAELQFVAYVTP